MRRAKVSGTVENIFRSGHKPVWKTLQTRAPTTERILFKMW